MAEFNGQTGKVTEIKMTSALISARWGQPVVAIGGGIPIEVRTRHVSDGSKIKIAVKDGDGKDVETLNGFVYSDLYRFPYQVKADAAKTLYFEAELPDHNLKGRSAAVKVVFVKITDLKWLGEDGKEIEESKEEQVVTAKAKLEGAVDGTPADLSIQVKLREKADRQLYAGQIQVQGGAIELSWKSGLKEFIHAIRDFTTLAKVGEDYYPPEFRFTVRCLGFQAESPPLTLTHTLVLRYEAYPGSAGPFEGRKVSVIAPDGSKSEKTIPADGRIEIEQSKPGNYRIEEDDIADLLG